MESTFVTNVLIFPKKIIDDELKADSIKETKDLPKPMEIKKATR